MAEVLVAGCGYVGAALAGQLAAGGARVFGLRRRAEGLPAPIVPVAADLTDPVSLDRALAAAGASRIDALVYAAAADRSDDAAYRAAYVVGLRNAIAAVTRCGGAPRRVFFISSTAVYAQRDGKWVDENSATEPTHWSGVRMLEAERLLLESGLPATALRLGGIYGPGRTRLIESVRSGRAAIRPGPPRYTNRIHRDDAVGALQHLVARALGGQAVAPVYVGVDDEPSNEATVLRWLAEQLGAPAPGIADSTRETERGGSNKRCLNALVRASGYRFRYPTFREGYAAMLAELGLSAQ